MSDSGPKLKCPKCVGLLEAKEYGRGEGTPVEVDVCWSCSGIWFDKGELEKVLRLKIRIERVAPSSENPQNDDFKRDHAKCPRCNVEFAQIKSSLDRRLMKEVCPKCFGTWLDGGELGDLERGGSVKRFLQSIQEHYQEMRDEREERKK